MNQSIPTARRSTVPEKVGAVRRGRWWEKQEVQETLDCCCRYRCRQGRERYDTQQQRGNSSAVEGAANLGGDLASRSGVVMEGEGSGATASSASTPQRRKKKKKVARRRSARGPKKAQKVDSEFPPRRRRR